jgi:son of sevenless-like protein
MTPPSHLTTEELTLWAEKKLTPVRLRVYNVLKAWFENFYLEEDEVVMDAVNDFASDAMRRVMPSAASKLTELINKRVSFLYAFTLTMS